jgi:hypothetical protein
MTGEERATFVLDDIFEALVEHVGLLEVAGDAAEGFLEELRATELMSPAPFSVVVPRLGALANLLRILRQVAEELGHPAAAGLRRRENMLMRWRDGIAARQAREGSSPP